MTTITDTMRTVAGDPDNSEVVFFVPEMRPAASGTATVTMKRVPITPVNGAFTVTLDPGLVYAQIGSGRSPFVVPASGTARMGTLIAQYLPPTSTPTQVDAAIAAWLEDNPLPGGGGLTVDQIATAATTSTPLKTALDQSYAPVSVVEDVDAAAADAATASSAAASASAATTALAVRNKNRDRNAVTSLGDSITALGGNQLGNEGANYYAQACVRSGQRIRWVYNGGIPSNNLAQMLARVQTDVIAKNAGTCLIMAGTNNMGNPMGDPAVAGTPGYIMKQIVAELQAANIRPVLCTIPPRNDNLALNANVTAWNAWLTFWGERSGILVIDTYAAIVNPATGAPAAGMVEADNVHPTAVANARMAEVVVTALAADLRNSKPRLASSSADPSNLLGASGLFLVDANADGYGDTWAVSGTPVGLTPTLVDDAAIAGKWQKFSRAAGSTGDLTLRREFFTGWAVGNRLALAMRVRSTGCVAGGHKWSIQIDQRGNAGSLKTVNPMYLWQQDIVDGILYYEFDVAADVNNIRVNIVSHGTGAGDVSFAQASLWNLTALKV
jgi:lysophospholipase L1-like esterase